MAPWVIVTGLVTAGALAAMLLSALPIVVREFVWAKRFGTPAERRVTAAVAAGHGGLWLFAAAGITAGMGLYLGQDAYRAVGWLLLACGNLAEGVALWFYRPREFRVVRLPETRPGP